MPTFGSIIGVGVPGETGPAGPTGPTGPQGPTGPAGPSAPLSGATPAALGSAAAGASTDASRADHVHAMPTAADVGACSSSDTRLSDARPPSTAGTNGGVLAYAAGAWASTGAGTERQILTSAGAGAPTWGVDVLPLTQRAVDGLGTSVTTCAVLAHDLAAGGGGAGIGARCEMQARNSASTLVAAAGVDGVLTDATGGAEVGALDVRVRSGGVLAAQLRVSTDTLSTYTGSAWVALFARSGGEWLYGSTDAANGGNAVLQAPSSGAGLYLRRGATNHVSINSAGALTVGTTSHTTAIQGTAVTLAGSTGLQIGYTAVVAVYVGGARVPETTISTSTTLDASHEVVFVDTTSGAVTLTLPAGASGRVLAVQRIAGANNIVIQRAGSDTIRKSSTSGLTSWTVSDDARHGLIYRSDGTEWVAEA